MNDCASVLAALAAKKGSVLSKCSRTRRDLRTGSTVSEDWNAETTASSERVAGSTATGSGPRRSHDRMSPTKFAAWGAASGSSAGRSPARLWLDGFLRSPMSSTALSASERLFSSSWLVA